MDIIKEKKMKTKYLRFITACFLGVIMIVSFSFAGDETRVGTSGGNQVLVPVGARDLALSGSDLVFSSGVSSIHWNPAGLARMEGGGAVVSNMTYFTDMGVNFFAAGFTGGFGAMAISAKTIDFGDIPVTTVQQMDGTGAMFTPTFATIAFSYAKSLIDKASVGVNAKLVYESIPRANATALVFDVGVQYEDFADIKGLGIGLVIKNIGQDLKYGGSALLLQATDAGNTFRDFRGIEAAEDQLPSVYEVGMTYKTPLGLSIGTVFSSQNYDYDQLRFGGEFALADMIFLRGGMTMALASGDATIDDEDELFSQTFGAGLKYNLFGMNTFVDFTYRAQQYFDGNMMWSFGVEF